MNTIEFDKIEKQFLGEMQRIFNEVNDSVTCLRNKRKFVKSEFCLVLICADSFSRFYKILQGSSEEDLDKEIGKRFKKWLNDFVFTDKNDVYKKYKNQIRFDANFIWTLRNSLLHFYGLPKQSKEGNSFGFWGGSVEERDRIEKEFRRKGHKLVFIQPYITMKAILEGFLLQLSKMAEMIENEPKNYIDRVLLAHKIAMTEGAVFINVDKK